MTIMGLAAKLIKASLIDVLIKYFFAEWQWKKTSFSYLMAVNAPVTKEEHVTRKLKKIAYTSNYTISGKLYTKRNRHDNNSYCNNVCTPLLPRSPGSLVMEACVTLRKICMLEINNSLAAADISSYFLSIHADTFVTSRKLLVIVFFLNSRAFPWSHTVRHHKIVDGYILIYLRPQF